MVAETADPALLSDSEQARWQAITAPARRAQFIAGRLVARCLLAAAFGGDAMRDWSLAAPEDQPPQLIRSPWPEPLYVSISHSGDWVAVAVCKAPVGVDLESPQRKRDVLALADAVFTADEQARLRALPEAKRAAGFYQIWTLKEAWLKRRTEGVSPTRLAQLRTRPCAHDEHTNAFSWQEAGLALSVAVTPGNGLRWYGPGHLAGLSPVSAWQVQDIGESGTSA